MCLYTAEVKGTTIKERSDKVTKTAKTDILVYKALSGHILQNGKSVYNSPYRSFKYTEGEIYKVSKFGICAGFGNQLRVDQGFHAYTSRAAARRNWSPEKIKTMVIPKGTPYILSRDNREIVSLSMGIYTKPVAPKELKFRKKTKKK